MTLQTIDEGKLEGFVSQAVGELGAALNAALVVIGDRLGLYKAMAGATGADVGCGHNASTAMMAEAFPGTGYDLVTTFDCLHDKGDPITAAHRIRRLAETSINLVFEARP